jgi:glycosyltransferase involved in cell wall biosynthesis
MRVLLIANTLPPRDVSGVGEQVLQLAAGLRELGHQVEILGRGPGGVAGPKLLFPLCAAPAARRAIARLLPHVVQVHESDGALAALLVVLLRRISRRMSRRRLAPPPLLAALLQVSYVEERRAVRSLVDRAGGSAGGGRVLGRPGAVERRFRWGKAPWQIALGRLIARLADLVLAPSAATAGELARDYGAAAVAVVPNVTGGLDVLSDGSPEAASPEDAEPPGYLLFVGRLRIRKGVEVLLEAVARLSAARSDLRLLVAGDGEHRAALERRARELGRARQVAFLGRCDAARVRRLLAGARALAVPSIYEGMPLVVLEAMEAGVPVVASRVSGIPEVVADGETGWLVPPEDPAALAAALAAALDDPAEAMRRGAAGRQRLDERFRPAVAARAWEREVAAAARRKGIGWTEDWGAHTKEQAGPN